MNAAGNQQNSNYPKTKEYFIIIGIFIGIPILWFLAAWLIYSSLTYFIVFDADKDIWAVRGTFGDSFGAVNGLFTGLAFAGTLYAIWLQKKDLATQQEANEKQASEITEQTKAIAEQTKSIANELLEHEKQTKELARQIRLSIMPAFVIQVVKDKKNTNENYWGLKMNNIGNGSATNITFDNIVHLHKEPTVHVKTAIEVLPVSFMEAKKEPIILEYIGKSYNSEGRVSAQPISSKMFTEIILEYKKDNPYTLKIAFEDIEGTKYQQEIKIGYRVSIPGQVKEVK